MQLGYSLLWMLAVLLLPSPARAADGAVALLPASTTHLAYALAGAASFAAAWLTTGLATRAIAPPAALLARTTRRPRTWLGHVREQLLVILMFAPSVPLLIFMAYSVGPSWDPRSVACALLGLGGFVVTVFVGGLPIGWLLGAVETAGPELRALVHSVGERAGVQAKGVYVLDLQMLNAFALPFSGRIAVTRALVEELTIDELESVIAHELGHLSEGRDILAPRLIAHFAWLPWGLGAPLIHSLGLWGWNIVLITSLVLLVLAGRARRAGEVRADAVAQGASAHSDVSYARALLKMCIANATPAVMWGRPIHPHLYDRAESAGLTPDFERPAPPSRMRLALGALITLPLLALSILVPHWTVVKLGDELLDADAAARVRIGASVAVGKAYFQLARSEMAVGNDERSLRLLEEAIRIRPGRHGYVSARAALLARLGNCAAANLSFDEAVALLGEGPHLAECRWILRAIEELAVCDERVLDERLSSTL